MYKKKTIVIIVICAVILLMGIGYAAFSTNLKINGTGAITSTWRVEFSAIRTQTLTGGAKNKTTPSVTATTATFEVDLVQPGDEITYEIDITNYGTIDAVVQGATYTISGSEAVYVYIDGVEKGTEIRALTDENTNNTETMILKVGYNPTVTSDPSNKTKTISITLNIGQLSPSNPITKEELIPELKENLAEKILSDNTALSDSSLSFSAISSDSNGKGLYYTSTNTEDNKTTYYFRGDVKNNYVYFAGFLWRIVRINEDGSIRIITQDTVKYSKYYEFGYDNAHVGYMYGTTGASTYAATHTNTNSSTIKSSVDSWYTSNLSSYSSYLADAGFCNDRSLISGTGYSTTYTTYGVYSRLNTNKKPQFKCPQTNDLFTLKGGTKGNKALTNPIGLLTADEVAYAGGLIYTSNSSYYLYNGTSWWTMSPMYFDSSNAITVDVTNYGSIYNYNPTSTAQGVRPVVNLKASTPILSGGKGTKSNPYVVVFS